MKKERCCICGDKCSGNRIIEARKGKYYNFCTFHFNEYLDVPIEEIRKQIKFNKKLLKA
jgi:hypothetical protein